MAQRIKRDQNINLRLSRAEKATVEERAQAANLKVSEYIRREAGIGLFGRAALRQPTREAIQVQTSAESPPGSEKRVEALALTMPLPSARRLVAREEARERLMQT